jgi:hypothetical protein
MTGLTRTVAIAAGALLSASSLAAQADFELRRELATGARFEVRNIIGDVRIEPASGRTLDVRAVKREGRHGDPRDVEIRAVELSGGGVAVCVYYPSSGRRDDDSRGRRGRSGDSCNRDGWHSNNERNDTRVDFTIRVPANLKLDLATVAGDVIGRGLSGEVEVRTVSGDLRLSDVRGSRFEATTVSGDIDLRDIDAATVEAETVSGDVNYTGSIQRDGEYFFKTLSGDVELGVPGRPDATLRGSTFSGRLVSDFPTSQGDRRRRNRFSATWGSGSASIEVESFSGDVRIRSSR